jgi:FG-GAP-like repeat/FG-GAP repeat
MYSGKSKTQFNRTWLAGIVGCLVLFSLVSDRLSGHTAQALSAGCSWPSFSAPTSFGTGQDSRFVAAGDFNNDGKQDLVVANREYFSSDVSLLLGDGTGSFGTAKHFPVGREPVYVVVGDFNGDQNLDFATANSYVDRAHPMLGTVSVRLGDGKGDFGPAIDTPAGASLSSLATGDFNNDGRLDLAVGTAGYAIVNEGPFIVFSGGVSVLLGDGAGGFNQSQAPDFQNISVASIATGDLNGDGKLDLALGVVPQQMVSGGADHVMTMIGNGGGKFTIDQDFVIPGAPISVLLGDFNHDGKLDLVNVDSMQGEFFKTITIRLGTGTGSFASPNSLQIASNPKFVAAGDFNLDGNLDLAVTNGRVYVLLGDGSGGFGLPTDQARYFDRMATGDFNNDGKPDLALLNTGFAQSVSVVLNTCGTPTPPQLFASEQDNRGAVVDSVIVRDPFRFTSNTNFSSDQRTRIVLFATNIDLQPGEDAASVTVRMENSQHAIFSVPAESVGKIPTFSYFTQINVRLPDELANGGDVSMSVIYHGLESNKVSITIKPPAN